MNSYHIFLLFILFIYGVQAAFVSYVSNSECATPQGCDFNSPIWSINGTPSAQDDVTIVSDVPITIWINNTLTTLNSLVINSSDVSFVVQNGYLGIVSTVLQWVNGSSVQINNSTLSALNAVIVGYNMLVINGVISSNTSAHISNLTATSSSCYFSFLYVDYMNTYGSTLLNVTNTLSGGSIELSDTWSSVTTISISGCGGLFSFRASDPRYTLYAGELDNLCSEALIGDGVTATFTGSMNSLTVGDGVTLNFACSEVYSFQEIQHIYQPSSTNPLKINILNGCPTYMSVPEPLIADVYVSGTLQVGNLTVKGSVYGPGILVYEPFSPAYQISAINIAVQQVNTQYSVGTGGGLIATHHFNTSFLNAGVANTTVNAPETYISTPGLSSSNYLFFNGSLIQTGGYINITAFWNHTSIVVLGSVSLTNVYIYVEMWTDGDGPQKISLIKSLSKQIKVRGVGRGLSAYNLPSYSFKTSDGELYLDREPAIATFMKRNYVFVAIGGSVVLAILVLAAFQVRLVRNRKLYSQIH